MNTDPAVAAGTEVANIHLEILGETRVFPVTFPLGPRTLLDLLPPARELTWQATAVALERARAAGREVSCRAGCGACCRQLVAISVLEALSLADLVAALPPQRQQAVRERFVAGLQRLESAGMLDPSAPPGQRALLIEDRVEPQAISSVLGPRYFALAIPCPFLENESCSIHPERPLVCREYHVTSPAETCAKLYRDRVDSVQPPLHMSDVLARTVALAVGTVSRTIPLVLALEWVEANGDRLRELRDGMEMFRTLVREMDREYEKPFESRVGL